MDRFHPHPNPSPVEGEGLDGDPTPSPSTGEGRGGGETRAKRTTLIPLARDLRKNMTDAERHLWKALRMRNLPDHKFRRQLPIGPYIVDFVCLPARLIVEVDGSQHLESEADRARDAWLVEQGFRVMRFWNHEVLAQTEAVLEAILAALPESHPHPNPSPVEGEGLKGAGSQRRVSCPSPSTGKTRGGGGMP